MSQLFRSQAVHLLLLHFTDKFVPRGKQKTLLTFGKQGLRKSINLLLPAYLRFIQTCFGVLPAIRNGSTQAKHTTQASPAMTCRTHGWAMRDRRRRPSRC